jgi:hypothetical protein
MKQCPLDVLCITVLGSKVNTNIWGAFDFEGDSDAWQSVTERHEDLGGDFFQHCYVQQSVGKPLGSSDGCRYHVHEGAKVSDEGFGGRCPFAADGGLAEWVVVTVCCLQFLSQDICILDARSVFSVMHQNASCGVFGTDSEMPTCALGTYFDLLALTIIVE